MSSQQIDFLKAFEKGYLRVINLHGTDDKKLPPRSKHWLVLSGMIVHITGTITGLYLESDGNINIATIAVFQAATASGAHPLFSAIVSDFYRAMLWQPLVLSDDMQLHFSGDATATSDVLVLEW